MRKFYIQNSAGERLPLNGENNIYLTDPTGLGLTLAPSFADLKRGFFRGVSDDAEPQNTFNATLTFAGADPYTDYQTFVNWLQQAGQLYLIYEPVSGSEFMRQIDVSYLSKSELNNLRWLVIPAAFFCVSPWYRPAATELELTNVDGNAIVYPFRYRPTLIYGDDSASSLSAVIFPAGHTPGAIELSYYGAILNPRVRLVGNASGKTYGLCSVTAAMGASDRFELSTLYRDSYVRRVSAGGIETDLLDSVSLATEPFFHFPVDEPSTLTVEADEAFTGSAALTLYYYYRTV